MSGLSDQARNELAVLCHSIEIATDEHGDGATLMLEPASRLVEGLAPWVVAREARARRDALTDACDAIAALISEHGHRTSEPCDLSPALAAVHALRKATP